MLEMKGVRNLLVAALTATLVLSCVPLEKNVKAPKNSKPKKTSSKRSHTGRDRAKIDKLLKKGEYREALVVINKAVKRGEKESAYQDSRTRALIGLINRGQELETDRKFAEAARNYLTALDHYPKSPGYGIEKRPEDLKKKLLSFEPSLMEEGLRHYRDGRLEEAVRVWDTLLSINPRHAQARKARETAKTQLKNLKKLK